VPLRGRWGRRRAQIPAWGTAAAADVQYPLASAWRGKGEQGFRHRRQRAVRVRLAGHSDAAALPVPEGKHVGIDFSGVGHARPPSRLTWMLHNGGAGGKLHRSTISQPAFAALTGPHDSEARSPLRVTNVVFWLHRPIGFAPDKLPACGYGAMALSAITGRRQTELGSRPTNDIGMLVMLAAASRFGPGACVRPAQRAPIFRLLLLPSKPIGSSNNTAKRPGLSKTVWTSRFSPGRSGKRELESGRCRDSC
jgi:hypothetical protein